MIWGPQDRTGVTSLEGGVTAATGFLAGGVAAGLKASGRPDLALVAAPGVDASAAVVTTTNRVKAPACVVSERNAADGHVQAVIINSGNANVCTPDGTAHAEQMARATSEALRIAPSSVLVMSTGVIGVPLPIERVLEGIPAVVEDLSEDGGHRAAEAILTTDTVTKEIAVEVADDRGRCVIGGMAKGVGMIEPSMATLLVTLCTDAPLGATGLRQALRSVVRQTFNRISIDGDCSTSDTVALLASGAAERPPGLGAFTRGLHAVCADLAHAVVADGEGATRVAAVTVSSARSEEAADALARAVATSPLVRAAIHGADPNWGRIMMAMGSADAEFDPARVSINCGGVTVCRFGVAAAFDRGQAAAAMKRDEIEIIIDVGAGRAAVTLLTCDLTPEYVRFNAEYTT